MINIVLAEDHSIVRNGIRSLLEKEPDLKVTGEATNGQIAKELIISQSAAADVLITDINMPELDGIQLTAALRGHSPVKVIILTMLDQEQYAQKAFDAGASGYLLKNISNEEMLFAIRHVSSGKQYLCSEMAIKLLNKLEKNREMSFKEPAGLSARELEVLKLVAEGLTNNEIADRLFTSRRTIEGHRFKLLHKTGTKNTAALMRYAIQYRIV
ncbi:response regulator [Hufsiella ginkgonis]|uniref:Response regulator n=1 Tax=Hufsiella ginkgonis TaxID=2695274 RepID=A0A7K1Y1B2_9SPHI|nr:response regulator transcription factor [Hufsiella ginkgonis]MXV16809.1 response regulator [Hufsiella ginkgonis]